MVAEATPPVIPCNRCSGILGLVAGHRRLFYFILLIFGVLFEHVVVELGTKCVDEVSSAVTFASGTHFGVLLVDVAVWHIYAENLCEFLDDFFG